MIGIYLTGILFHLLFKAVIPLTAGGGWRGIAHVIVVRRHRKEWRSRVSVETARKTCCMFLVAAHVAMIFGTLNLTLLM